MKQLQFPDSLTDYSTLTPLELNAYRFAGRHTPLTPEMLETDTQKAAQKASSASEPAKPAPAPQA